MGRVFSPLIAVVTAALLVACGASSESASSGSGGCEKTYTIGFSHSVSEASIVKTIRDYAERRAKDVGCVKLLQDNTQAGNVENQVRAVDAWVTQRVDAIVVLPTDPGALAGVQERAQSAGIKWLTYATEVAKSDGFVGFNNEQSGKLVGDAAVAWSRENHPDGPAKALLMTLEPVPSASGRWVEPERILKAAGIDIVATQDAADQATGLRVTEDVLRRDPDLSIVIGFNDDAALGAYRAFRNAKKDPDESFIVGQDGSLDALQAIRQGQHYKASAALRLKELGRAIVDAPLEALREDKTVRKVIPSTLASQEDNAGLERLLEQF